MSHTTLKHIIWDWNGTLLDDTWLCVELINRVLTKRGLKNVDTDAYRADFGFPIINFYHFLGIDMEEESFEAISAEFILSYQQRWRECRLHPHAPETLLELKQRGYTQSVLSASGQSTLEEAIRHFGIDAYFLGLIGQGDDFAHGKIESGKTWVSGLDWEPSEILLIGDTLHDFEVAREIGLHCALVDCGHHPRERLNATGVPVISCLEQLLPLLNNFTIREPGVIRDDA